MRDSGWDSFLDQVSSFYGEHNIMILNKYDKFVPWGQSQHKAQ